MIKWAKICDEAKGTVIVGMGDDSDYYASEEFEKMDVEQAYTGEWYLAGRAPVQPLSELKDELFLNLWQNYKKWQEDRVDAEDLVLASMGSLVAKPKCTAVRNWVMDLWTRYYSVKDQIVAAATVEEAKSINLSADECGEPPYTIRELNEEVKGGQAE